jgi:ribonuclease Z
MDHFGGFDRLLRVCLNRPAPLHLLGPPAFIDQVEHRIRSYTWNLVGDHSEDFRLFVSEFSHGRITNAAAFAAREAFARRSMPCPDLPPGVVLQEDSFRIEAATLEHAIPCLAFCLREPLRVNVLRGALEALNLPVGPWLAAAKRAARQELAGDTPIAVGDAIHVPLSELTQTAFRIGPGQAVAYVTDTAPTPGNADAVVALAQGADQLFIEAVFLERDRAFAEASRHLTAADAGRIARRAGVKHLNVFHHSARYSDAPQALREEAFAAFRDSETRPASAAGPRVDFGKTEP